MLRLFLFFLLNGSALLRAQVPKEDPEIVVTDVAAALYVSGWEVGKEIVVRPLALPYELRKNVPRSGPMKAADRETLKPLVTEFFSKVFTIIIDGSPASFVPEKISFIAPDPENFVEFSATTEVPAEDFMIIVKYSAPLPSLDSTIAFTWDYFPDGLGKVPIRIADTMGTRLIEVNPASGQVDAGVRLAVNLRDAPEPPPVPEITTGKAPWFALGTAGVTVILLLFKLWKPAIALGILAAIIWLLPRRTLVTETVSPEEAAKITDSILENVYHAFNLPDENTQYDQLENVLDGTALESTFLEARRTTNRRAEDGSRVRVRTVTVTQATPKQEPGELNFTAICQWETVGDIGHWEHFHRRKNLYSAAVSLAVSDGKWKATELDLNSRERERE